MVLPYGCAYLYAPDKLICLNNSKEPSPTEWMCLAAASSPGRPLIQSAGACWCPNSPDVLGHTDLSLLDRRVFPYNLWQLTLRAVQDYAPLLSALPSPQLSQRGQGHHSGLPPISVYMRRQLGAAVPEKQTRCLSSRPCYQRARAGQLLNQPEMISRHLPGAAVCLEQLLGLQDGLAAGLRCPPKLKPLGIQ